MPRQNRRPAICVPHTCVLAAWTDKLSVERTAAGIQACVVAAWTDNLSVESIAASIDNNATHAPNCAKDCDDSPSNDACPGSPKLPVGNARLLH